MFDIIHVHGDGAHVSEQARSLAIRGNVDVLADVGAVEQERVEASLTFNDIAAVARIPLGRVVAGAKDHRVVALLTVDEVIAVAADQQVGSTASGDHVVAGAAVDGELDGGGVERRGRDRVVAAEPPDDELVGCF